MRRVWHNSRCDVLSIDLFDWEGEFVMKDVNQQVELFNSTFMKFFQILSQMRLFASIIETLIG